jgi:hypothetical protein
VIAIMIAIVTPTGLRKNQTDHSAGPGTWPLQTADYDSDCDYTVTSLLERKTVTKLPANGGGETVVLSVFA